MTSDERSGLTRRAVLRGAAAAGAASLVAPGAGIAALTSATPGVFSRWVGTVAGESAPIAAPRRFALVGVEWAAPADATIELRTRDGRRRLVPVDDRVGARSRPGSAGDRGPHGRAVRRADLDRPRRLRAAPQLPRGARGVRLHFVAPRPVRGDPGNARGICNRRAGVPAGPAGARRRPRPAADHRPLGLGAGTRAAQPRPSVRDRQARVRPPQRDAQRLRPRRGPVDPAARSSTTTATSATTSTSPTTSRSTRSARIWEARAGGIDLPIVGAHAGGYNEESTGHGRARLVHGRRALAGGDRRARAPARVEARAPRRPRARPRHGRGRRRTTPSTPALRPARTCRCRASPATATATRRAAPATRSTPGFRRCARGWRSSRARRRGPRSPRRPRPSPPARR